MKPKLTAEESGEWRTPFTDVCQRLDTAARELRDEMIASSRRTVLHSAARISRGADAGRGRALVVEDDDIVARSIERELTVAGLSVIKIAPTFELGRTHLLEAWELVVTDILLHPPRSAAELLSSVNTGPPRDGLELVRIALASEARCVVIVTAWAAGAELERIRLDSGAHYALSKPWPHGALRAIVEARRARVGM